MGESIDSPIFMLETYQLLTSELSKLENDLINNCICSHEDHLEQMSAEELYEVAQELIWMAQDMQNEPQEYDEEEYDSEGSFVEDTIEEAETLLEKLAEFL